MNEGCVRCPELVKSRKQITWGYGNIKSGIIFIGEAPGKYGCDKTGIPFFGDKSGDLFQKMLNSVGWTKELIYTTNVVKCCPPENRKPDAIEIENCYEYLDQEITAALAKNTMTNKLLIIPVGSVASGLILSKPISACVMQVFSSNTKICIPIFHPAYVLRGGYPESKYEKDFKVIREIYGEQLNEK